MKKLFCCLAFAALLELISFSDAEAYCSEPSMYETAPSAPGSFSKPNAPYCLSGYSYSGTHTCSEWEISNYIDEINNYIRKLKAYAEEANDFANAAINFSDEAVDYVNCEARDAKSEIE